MVKSFYQTVLGIELQSYYDRVPESPKDTQCLIHIHGKEFHKVDSMSFGDILVYKFFNIESHIAVFVGDDKILHSMAETGCVVERMHKWQHLLAGIYRPIK